MANLQRIYGNDGLPYLIDTSGDGFNVDHLPWSTVGDDLELGSEPLSFAANADTKDVYKQGMTSFGDMQARRPLSIDAVEASGDLSKLTFLSPEKTNYQDIDQRESYGKDAGDEIKAQFKKEFGYTPSSGELNQYANLGSKRSPLRSVLVVPQKTESRNTKRISDNFLDNIKNGNLNVDSIPFYSLAQNALGNGKNNFSSGIDFSTSKSNETIPGGLLAIRSTPSIQQNTTQLGNESASLPATVNVYSSDAFGIPGLNHAYVGSPETGQQKGRDGLFGITKGPGGYGFKNPYHSVTIPDGMTAREFMNRIQNYPGWNGGLWFPWVNDCHNDLEDAFKYAGAPYPGAPNGRLDIDDDATETVKRVINEARQWVDTQTNGGKRR
ncbi:hypothetical protein ACO0LF_19405 [Undibacterium sp. Di27W]|uniref:hypothetical protein n=1 Tax=Undibacterium sp. Di27W TaxID=3413036 RepID=UPI003BEFB8E9